VTLKLLSENSRALSDAASAGIAALMTRYGEAPIAAVKMGTTVATNALLERTGEPTWLAITRGTRTRSASAPEPAQIVRAGDRLRAAVRKRRRDRRTHHRRGESFCRSTRTARAELEAAFAEGYRALAIVLMHAYGFRA